MQSGIKCARVGKASARECFDGVRSRQASKLTGAVLRQEQRGGEAAVLVRQRDQHVVAARPDVQRVGRHSECRRPHRREWTIPCSRARDRSPAPRSGPARSCAAHRRARAIGGEQRLHRHAEQRSRAQDRGCAPLPSSKSAASKRCSKCMVTPGWRAATSSRTWLRRCREIEIDHFIGPLTVGLKRGVARPVMNEPAAHRQQRGAEILEHAGHLEGVNAAIGERQIDGAARRRGGLRGSGRLSYSSTCEAAPLQQNARAARRWGRRRRCGSTSRFSAHCRSACASASTRGEHVAERVVERRPAPAAARPVRASRRSRRPPSAAHGSAWQRRRTRRCANSVDSRAPPAHAGVMISTRPGSTRSMRRCRKPVSAIDFSRSRSHAGALKDLQRRQQRCRGQDRRIADLPTLRAGDRVELGSHLETASPRHVPTSRQIAAGRRCAHAARARSSRRRRRGRR